jgi:hypothetical protein
MTTVLLDEGDDGDDGVVVNHYKNNKKMKIVLDPAYAKDA